MLESKVKGRAGHLFVKKFYDVRKCFSPSSVNSKKIGEVVIVECVRIVSLFPPYRDVVYLPFFTPTTTKMGKKRAKNGQKTPLLYQHLAEKGATG